MPAESHPTHRPMSKKPMFVVISQLKFGGGRFLCYIALLQLISWLIQWTYSKLFLHVLYFIWHMVDLIQLIYLIIQFNEDSIWFNKEEQFMLCIVYIHTWVNVVEIYLHLSIRLEMFQLVFASKSGAMSLHTQDLVYMLVYSRSWQALCWPRITYHPVGG